ncbi:MAG TPA: Hsp20/alpha crystallin family protein [Blastocatellia bacterium]|nr:Hsp20/alpha crystallin family protein [Blastocatellia bacterium]
MFSDQFRHEAIAAGTWSPPIDIYETTDDIVVTAELPGIKREDIEVTVVGDKLLLRGSRVRERDSDGEQFHRMERQYGSFYRSFNLPQAVDSDAINARLAQGVLYVTLPKRPIGKTERIEISD